MRLEFGQEMIVLGQNIKWIPQKRTKI